MEHYLDIQGVPRRYFFELLSHFTTSELEKEKLQEFCSAEGQVQLIASYAFDDVIEVPIEYVSCCYETEIDSIFQEELYSYCYRQKRTTLEVRLMLGLVSLLRYRY